MRKEQNNITLPADEQNEYHIPVLLHEAIEGLAIKPDGIYVDCTFGGGGHSRAILAQLNANGKLVAFDQDADAVQNLPDDPRIIFVPENFRHIGRFLKLHQITQVDGILADLGVSSHQFDEATRGFSIRFDADLDMRMDQRQEKTAAQVISNSSAAYLHKLFEKYGEVTNAKTLANTLVEKRSIVPIKTIQDFKQATQSIVKGNPQKYLAQVFQALRIEVNDEFGALEILLEQIPLLLKPGGRAAFITFHSLEDRLVKVFFKSGSLNESAPDQLYGTRKENPFILVNKKPILPSEEEYSKNKRSRSAKLRVAEKV
ncbi:MAG: 16S rRNA (cytosine(1402)-N(4))-methyltransferase RsmH [Ferruginibacter sp.]